MSVNVTHVSSGFFIGFCEALRDEGFNISPQNTAIYLDAVQIIQLDDIGELYWAARATLMSGEDFVREFDSIFQEYFHLHSRQKLEFGKKTPATDNDGQTTTGARSISAPSNLNEVELADGPSPRGRASRLEKLSARRFDLGVVEEGPLMANIAAYARRYLPEKKSRRYCRGYQGQRVDLRRCMKQLPRFDGELIRVIRRKRRTRKRPVVILLDVSGSMSLQVRSNLLFCYAISQGVGGVECFCIGTRLTRISRILSGRNINLCLEQVGAAVLDWEGGTRLGDALDTFVSNRRNFERLRGAEVLVISDGLERGALRKLIAHSETIARNCHQVHWISPLAGGTNYQPITRAAQALIPIIGKPHPGGTLNECYHSLRSVWQ